MICFVPPSQEPTTLPGLAASLLASPFSDVAASPLATMSSVNVWTPCFLIFASISDFSSSQGLVFAAAGVINSRVAAAVTIMRFMDTSTGSTGCRLRRRDGRIDPSLLAFHLPPRGDSLCEGPGAGNRTSHLAWIIHEGTVPQVGGDSRAAGSV